MTPTKFSSLAMTVIAGLLMLSGCASLPAATIGVQAGDQTVRTSEIDDVVAVLGESTPYGVSTARIVQIFAVSAIADQYAADHDIAVNESDIDAATGSDPIFRELSDDPVANSFERRLIRTSLIGRQITSPDGLDSYDVVINPRYGVEWDPAKSALVVANTSLSDDHRS